MGNTAANVTTGKPLAAGGVYSAPAGAPLPSGAADQLAPAFVGLGYVSDSGVVNGIETDTESIKAWGGETVLVVTTSRKETFKFTFIETSEAVLREVYGPQNVTVENSQIAVIHRTVSHDPRRFVFEIALTGGRKKRIVVPNAKVTEVGDVKYVDGEPVGYEVTLSAMPDAQGVTAVEYIGAVQAPTTTPK